MSLGDVHFQTLSDKRKFYKSTYEKTDALCSTRVHCKDVKTTAVDSSN